MFLIPSVFLLGLCAVMVWLRKQAFWWFLFVNVFILFTSGNFINTAVLDILSTEPKPTHFIVPYLFIPLPITAYLIWKWGTTAFDTGWLSEIKKFEKVKRIDFNKGAYNPFVLPFLPKMKSLEFMIWGLSITGSLLIIIVPLTLGKHWTGRYVTESQLTGMYLMIFAFLLVPVFVLSTSLGEYRWIKKWEKERGRRMKLISWLLKVVLWKPGTFLRTRSTFLLHFRICPICNKLYTVLEITTNCINCTNWRIRHCSNWWQQKRFRSICV